MYRLLFIFFGLKLLAQDYAVVLQYHRFDEFRYPSTNISSKDFKKHLQYLKENNFTVWKLSKIIKYLKENKQLPKKTVAITIDDSYKSVYKVAYPILKSFNFPFTVFVNSAPTLHRSKRYMRIEEMQEMGKNGCEFANHTHTHRFLVRYDEKVLEKEVKKEILKCQKFIDKYLKPYKSPVKMLAYPFGEFDKRVKKIVKDLGYIGVAQNSAPISNKSDFLALTRFPLAGRYANFKGFKLKVSTKPMPITAVNNDTIVTPKNNPPKLTLKLQKKLKIECFRSNGERLKIDYTTPTTITIESKTKLKYPRDHYTCTAKDKDERWMWFSYMWVVLK